MPEVISLHTSHCVRKGHLPLLPTPPVASVATCSYVPLTGARVVKEVREGFTGKVAIKLGF